jgi:8-oxo-dGTP pyrophosphatase MutT (NUDIX family)
MSTLPSGPNPWRTHQSEVVFENPWVKIVRNDVTRPSGNPGIYSVVHFRRQAVGVIPVDEQGHTWLVGQFRFPTGTYEWEIPEGGAEPGESPLDCAKRELREEAGLLAEIWTPILEMQLSNSVTDEVSFTFLAQGLRSVDAEPEETEELAVRRVPLETAFAMAMNGEIRDAISVASLLKLQALLGSQEVRL